MATYNIQSSLPQRCLEVVCRFVSHSYVEKQKELKAERQERRDREKRKNGSEGADSDATLATNTTATEDEEDEADLASGCCIFVQFFMKLVQAQAHNYLTRSKID